MIGNLLDKEEWIWLRVRARITFHVWVLRRLSGKARGLRILLVWKGRATQLVGMDRCPNRESYSCANPEPYAD